MTETAVEWLCNEWLYIDQEFDMKLIDKKTYWERLKSVQEQAKAMEKEQREKCFIEGYKNRALLSNLIFDEASKLFAKSLFEQNQTFKSE